MTKMAGTATVAEKRWTGKAANGAVSRKVSIRRSDIVRGAEMAPGKAIPPVHHTCGTGQVIRAGGIAQLTPAGDHATPPNMGNVSVTTTARACKSTPLWRGHQKRNMDTPAGDNTSTQLRRGTPPLRIQLGEPQLRCSGGRHTLLRQEESPPQPRCGNQDIMVTPAGGNTTTHGNQAQAHPRATSEVSTQRGPHQKIKSTAAPWWKPTRPHNTGEEPHVLPGKMRAQHCTTHMDTCSRAAHTERYATRALQKNREIKCVHDLSVTHVLEKSEGVPLGRLNAAKICQNLASTCRSPICDKLHVTSPKTNQTLYYTRPVNSRTARVSQVNTLSATYSTLLRRRDTVTTQIQKHAVIEQLRSINLACLMLSNIRNFVHKKIAAFLRQYNEIMARESHRLERLRKKLRALIRLLVEVRARKNTFRAKATTCQVPLFPPVRNTYSKVTARKRCNIVKQAVKRENSTIHPAWTRAVHRIGTAGATQGLGRLLVHFARGSASHQQLTHTQHKVKTPECWYANVLSAKAKLRTGVVTGEKQTQKPKRKDDPSHRKCISTSHLCPHAHMVRRAVPYPRVNNQSSDVHQHGPAYSSNDAGDGPYNHLRNVNRPKASAAMKWVKFAVLSNNLNGLNGNLHKYTAEYWKKHHVSTSEMIKCMADYKNGVVFDHLNDEQIFGWCGCETWVPKNKHIRRLNGFQCISRERDDGKMGGVAIWVPKSVHKNLQVERVKPRVNTRKYARELQEIVWAKYRIADRQYIYMASVHIPSGATLGKLGSTVSEQVAQLKDQIRYFAGKGHVIIGGDFNLQRNDEHMKNIMGATLSIRGKRMRYMSKNITTRPKSGRKIDHIITTLPTEWIQKPLSMPEACDTLNTDHIGIGATLRLKVDKNRALSVPQQYQRAAAPQKCNPLKRYDVAKLQGIAGEAKSTAIANDMDEWATQTSVVGRTHTEVYDELIQKLRRVLDHHIPRARTATANARPRPGLGGKGFKRARAQVRRFRKRAENAESAGHHQKASKWRDNMRKARVRVNKYLATARATEQERYLATLAYHAEGKGTKHTKAMWKAARALANYNELKRGADTKSPFPPIRNNGPPPQTPAQAAANTAARWKEVGRDRNVCQHAQEWKQRHAYACQQAEDLAAATTWRPFTHTEIKKAIRAGKNGKSAGSDAVPYEVWKIMPDSVIDKIVHIFNQAVVTATLPSSWCNSTGVPLYKKGDATDAYNYRIISLTDTISKTFERALLARAGPILERSLHKWQHGFRKHRSTQMAGLLMAAATGMGLTMPEAARHGKTYVAFLDVRKAFPTTYRPAMLAKLHAAGINGHLFRAMAATYDKVTSRIQIGGDISDDYPVEIGVREGSVLSPAIYTTFLNGLLERIHNTPSNGVAIAGNPNLRVASMAYADDLALIASSAQELQIMLNTAAQYATEHCFRFAQKKSNIVVFGGDHKAPQHTWELPAIYHENPRDPSNNNRLEQVESYQYLGTVFHESRTWTAQFNAAAAKFHTTMADKWEDAGGIARGVDELACHKLWDTMVSPAIDYNPLVTASALANKATLRQAKRMHEATIAAQQAATGGRSHCHDGLALASGILPLEPRLARGVATAICQIMDMPNGDPIKRTLEHARDGQIGSRIQAGLWRAAQIASVSGPLQDRRRSQKATTYNAERDNITHACTNHAVGAVKFKLPPYTNTTAPHRQECFDIHRAKCAAIDASTRVGRKYVSTGLIGRTYTKGCAIGRCLYRQVASAGTNRNEYARRGPKECRTRCDDCGCDRDTNRHWIIHCPKNAAAREKFTRDTGITITDSNYIKIMALDAASLQISPECLSTALFRFLARADRRSNANTASVAPTRCNQGAREGHCRRIPAARIANAVRGPY